MLDEVIDLETSLDEILSGDVYQAYSYSYPHKTSYRSFSKPVHLSDIWSKEKLDSLFLYMHIPFCEMRCGFCNLFTLVRPSNDLPDLYLDALERQVNVAKTYLAGSTFTRFAIGGGTPTYLSVKQLDRLFGLANSLNLDPRIPIGIESSPDTISAEKIRLLESISVSRISMGVQSFTELETNTLARKQSNSQVGDAIEVIRGNSSADLNLDLIYGIAGQTIQSWLFSLKQALQYHPEELYLYPLYVRDKTGLSKIEKQNLIATDLPDADMLTLYRVGRDFLLSEGYEQVSMRMFRRKDIIDKDLPIYSCQDDGMLGLGAGARSYTRSVHYSSEYAVGRSGVKDIIQHYVDTPTSGFEHAYYGVELDRDEQKRRFVMQSLLSTEGLDTSSYEERFESNCFSDFLQIDMLIQGGLAISASEAVKLLPEGLERADSIGPWLTSNAMKTRMSEYKFS